MNNWVTDKGTRAQAGQGLGLRGRGDQLCDPKAPSSGCLRSVASSPNRDRETGVWTGGKGGGRPGQEQAWTFVSAGWAEAIRDLPLHISAVHGDSCPCQKNIPGSHTLPLRVPLSHVQPSSQRVFNTVQEVPKSLSQGLILCPVQAEFEILFTHRYTWPSFKTCASS